MEKENNPDSAKIARSSVQQQYANLAHKHHVESNDSTIKEERDKFARILGYSEEDICDSKDSNLGLSCGNPLTTAKLFPGNVVVDLGCGGGFDTLLAARTVGPKGRAIGIDMTEDMLTLARRNAERSGLTNTEFRQGYIEDIPIDDASCDAVISNCVINLSSDKAQVFREAARILKPGGWLSVTDIVLNAPLPPEMLNDMTAYAACIAGAIQKNEYLQHIEDAGLTNISVVHEYDVLSLIPEDMLTGMLARFNLPENYLKDIPDSVIVSAHIFAERH